MGELELAEWLRFARDDLEGRGRHGGREPGRANRMILGGNFIECDDAIDGFGSQRVRRMEEQE